MKKMTFITLCACLLLAYGGAQAQEKKNGVLEDANSTLSGKERTTTQNGKNSLINALIGKNILPVCTDVATSRVYQYIEK